MRKPLIALVLFAVFMTLGCTTQTPNQGLVMNMQADPAVVYQDSLTTIHMDLTNTDTKRLYNVVAEVFNTGLMKYTDSDCIMQLKPKITGTSNPCSPINDNSITCMMPDEFQTFACNLKSPTNINQDRVSTEVNARVSFDTDFAALQQIEMITDTEYKNRIATTGIRQKPQQYIYRDRNIELQIDFSEPLPLVVKPERNFYVKFTIRNIGNGFIGPIDPQNIRIIQKPTLETDVPEGDILQSLGKTTQSIEGYRPCELSQQLMPIGKEFPSFTCKVFMPKEIPPISTYNFIILIRYQYELRDSLKISILR